MQTYARFAADQKGRITDARNTQLWPLAAYLLP